MTEEEEQKEEVFDQSELLKESLKQCQDKYLRLLAESENTRKRLQKEKQETMKYAMENTLIEFLHPLDNFENALRFAESMSDEVRNWALGFEMILSQLRQVLQNHGVEAYDAVGQPFDPHLHEAIEMVATDEHKPGMVIEECVKGYKVGDRPIRVARVKVSKANEEGEKNDE